MVDMADMAVTVDTADIADTRAPLSAPSRTCLPTEVIPAGAADTAAMADTAAGREAAGGRYHAPTSSATTGSSYQI